MDNINLFKRDSTQLNFFLLKHVKQTLKLFTKINKRSKIVVDSGDKWNKVGDFYVYG